MLKKNGSNGALMRSLFSIVAWSVANALSNTFQLKMPGYLLRQMVTSTLTVYGYPVPWRSSTLPTKSLQIATNFNKISQKMLKGVGRKAASFMLKYVKDSCKGGKIWIVQEEFIWIIFVGSQSVLSWFIMWYICLMAFRRLG